MKPPISDPFGAPSFSNEQEHWCLFRIQFWRYFVMTLAGSLAWSLPVCWLVLAGERAEVQRACLIAGIMAGVVATLVMSIIMFWLAPAKMNRQKLKSTNFWGVGREIEWSQIVEVRFRWLFLPFAVISTSTKRNFIWLPLFLRDMKGFARAVEEWAPAGNPLRLCLQKRNF